MNLHPTERRITPDTHPELVSEARDGLKPTAPSPLGGESEHGKGNMTDSNGKLPENYITPSAPSNKTGEELDAIDFVRMCRNLVNGGQFDLTDSPQSFISNVRQWVKEYDERRAARQQTQST